MTRARRRGPVPARQYTLRCRSCQADMDPNNIAATMNDGVLTVAIGKAEQAKPKKIKIAATT
jgi:HSP20 family molecular chaperone IbpA